MNRRSFIRTSLMATAAAAGDALLRVSSSVAAEHDKELGMNILVLTGSPRMHGNSNTLADHFTRGAEAAGHRVARFDAAHSNVHACTGCNSCGMNGPCMFDDDFSFVRDHIVGADLVAFVTPMYYFGISSQLKAVIDRFYAINGSIHVRKQAVLLMTYANHSKRDESPILTHYDVLLEYLGWKDAGRVVAPGVWLEGSINNTPFPEQAYRLGLSLRGEGAGGR
ncbi:flavodoxin family protein [uncultured Mailhella sp.]|uniref:flavodoxin family protein n=1 Tax=uncultured Mailhella sp. TaxID=1981031 RepID=UPI0025E16694|nr:flavodoxin family protein [uncultured Mailhella sp.]